MSKIQRLMNKGIGQVTLKCDICGSADKTLRKFEHETKVRYYCEDCISKVISTKGVSNNVREN